jgi:hypothetical protein
MMKLFHIILNWLDPQPAHDSTRIVAAIQELSIIRAMALDDLAKCKLINKRWVQ